ncbi:AraC family transcriptional regulator [Arhodomonas sp. AD133]|uniref:AraC family transcriptional regulator n=1 Tax=Arhodomonas sp. AD133 TaxID=3415009 RepID=UPI003EBA9A8F
MTATNALPEREAANSPHDQLVRLVSEWVPESGGRTTAIEGLDLYRSDTPTHCESSVYEPSMTFAIQGAKSIQLGDREIVQGPLTYLASNVSLPVLGQIVDATPEQPALAARLTVDPQEVTDLVLASGDRLPAFDPDEACPDMACGLCTAPMDDAMQVALLRLLSLLDTPADIPVLAPLARREILYRALTGEIGPRIRKFAATDSQVYRVSRVIATLKDRYAQPLRVSDLAGEVNMSESSLFHSFKQVTRMSPLQFQKKLRLHEARRLMLAEGLEAAAASYRVGYESPSQFSREYRRLFGAPPRADVTKLRGGAEPARA